MFKFIFICLAIFSLSLLFGQCASRPQNNQETLTEQLYDEVRQLLDRKYLEGNFVVSTLFVIRIYYNYY